ncbi:MAG: preQ(1) synthase [Acidobacteriota bacterium]
MQAEKSKAERLAVLATFPNRHPGREYEVEITCPEFTAVCPRTGQPDFATIHIKYVPDQKIIELKSLKLYIGSYRSEGIFHEHVTNTILDDLVAACQPIRCEVVGDFNMRGGIKTVVRARYEKSSKLQVPSPK